MTDTPDDLPADDTDRPERRVSASDAGIGVRGGETLPTDPIALSRRWLAQRWQ
jgi:hypothetical protein